MTRILYLIPARAGSKAIPGKNKKVLGSKRLIEYTIEQTIAASGKNKIFISTDDRDIADLAETYGLECPFLRPADLASDHSSMHDVILHVLKYYEDLNQSFDILILLQPTSPFRTAKHIHEALSLFNNDVDMVVSVTRSSKNPYYNLFEETQEGFLVKSKPSEFVRRQDCPNVYEYNGAVYVINVEAVKAKALHEFTRVVKYEMDELSSHDIDTPIDWLTAEQILKSELLRPSK